MNVKDTPEALEDATQASVGVPQVLRMRLTGGEGERPEPRGGAGLELALEAGLGGPGGHPELGRLVRSGHGSRAQPGALRSLEVGTGRATARSAGAPGGPRGT